MSLGRTHPWLPREPPGTPGRLCVAHRDLAPTSRAASGHDRQPAWLQHQAPYPRLSPEASTTACAPLKALIDRVPLPVSSTAAEYSNHSNLTRPAVSARDCEATRMTSGGRSGLSYGSEGCRFESCRARTVRSPAEIVCGAFASGTAAEYRTRCVGAREDASAGIGASRTSAQVADSWQASTKASAAIAVSQTSTTRPRTHSRLGTGPTGGSERGRRGLHGRGRTGPRHDGAGTAVGGRDLVSRRGRPESRRPPRGVRCTQVSEIGGGSHREPAQITHGR